MVKNLILSGNPGTGKTTLVKEAVLPFAASIGGFYTEEIRENGQRVGFLLKTWDGRSAVLASKKMAGQARLNKYGIDLEALNSIGVSALKSALGGKKIVVIDEIGAMEVLSEEFRETVLKCLAGPLPVLATIRQGSYAFTDSVKKMQQTQVRQLSRENFNEVKEEVRNWLKHHETTILGR